MSVEANTQATGYPIIDHLDLWSNVYVKKAATGRGGNGGKVSPYGVQKLRELILELAVRGKLLPQDSNDEPASGLLDQIIEERVRLVKEKAIKRPKNLPPIADEEQPFPLPVGWEFVRLNDLGEWGAGATPSRRHPEYYVGTIPWFKSGELVSDFISDSEEHINELALKNSSLRFNKAGDVLIAMYGATIGKTSILKVRATTNQAVCACTPFSGFLNVFLLLLLKAYKHRFIGMGAGGAQPNISREKIIATVVALPSTSEQHRIVSKVDELMVLCDQLEQQQTESIQAHQTLVETLLRTLVNTSDAQNTQQAWNRIAEHFDTLFTTEESIDQLKRTILQLAVMGKLVPQDPNDKPASVLLEMIAEEKERLVKEKKIRRAKSVPELSFEERFSYLPEKWEEVRFAEFVIEVATGPFGSMVHKSDYINGGVQLINPSHMIDGKIIPDSSISVSDEKAVELESHNLLVGDVVMARRGEMGRCAVVTNESAGFLCGTGSFILRFHKDIDRSYVLLLFRSEYVRSYLGGESVGATMTNLNHGILNKMPIAVPPVEEQSRIVAKAGELMALCNALKDRIQDTQTTQSNLADAIVEQAVA